MCVHVCVWPVHFSKENHATHDVYNDTHITPVMLNKRIHNRSLYIIDKIRNPVQVLAGHKDSSCPL